MKTLPKFAVVGHPNKGKSSIVATLAHNDSIAISDVSGTTQNAHSYPYTLENTVLYELIDTPGFQRPRQVLSWLEKYANNAAERSVAVRKFTEEHKSTAKETGRFNDEIELLTPILNGAGIIYVVDGSVPYIAEYEAEMSVLQWTGQPRMALINPIGGEAYVKEWQQALGQYFSLVKVFNPMTAGIKKQLSILRAFAELNNDWEHELKQSITKIEQQFLDTHEQAAYSIAEAIENMLSTKKSAALVNDSLKTTIQDKLKQHYQRALVTQENQLRKHLIELYSHYKLKFEQTELQAEYPELLDQDYWYLFGLSRQKLITLSVSASAAAGAIIDVSLGGASLMMGALTGGVVGGAASIFYSAKPDRIQIKGMPLGGKQLVAGPVKNLQFAFVLLGRAIEYQKALVLRAHADKSLLVLPDINSEHWIETLDKTKQITLTRLLLKAAKGLSQKERKSLQGIILSVCAKQ